MLALGLLLKLQTVAYTFLSKAGTQPDRTFWVLSNDGQPMYNKSFYTTRRRAVGYIGILKCHLVVLLGARNWGGIKRTVDFLCNANF